MGQTDFSILEGHGLPTRAHKASPPIVDSVNAVCRMFKTAAGDTSMYVSNKCVGITESLEKTTWLDKNPDTATIDKTEGNEHYSDGIRYAIEMLFPIRLGTKTVSRGFGF